MQIAETQQPSAKLTIARHVAGMAAVALANPLIYYDASPVEAWALLPVGALLISSALFAVLALVSPARAKASWPTTPIKSAWLILVLMLLANWQGHRTQPAGKAPQPSEIESFLNSAQPLVLKPFHGKLDGE